MEGKKLVHIITLFSTVCLVLVLFLNLNDAFGQDTRQFPANQPGYHVKIISPTKEDIFYAGDTVPIKIEAEGVTPISVQVFCYKDVLLLKQKPFKGQILIRKDFIGKFGIVAVAVIDKVDPVASDEVEIFVKKKEKLISMNTGFETIYLDDKMPWQLQVEGEFEDDTVINISSSDTGTTYESSAPSFISVTKDGELELQSKSPSIAQVKISNSGIVKTIVAKASYIGNKQYEYFSDGTISAERSYKDHYFKDPTLHGIQKFYYKDGTLKGEVLRKDGHFDGPCKEYYSNGAIKSEVVYENSNPVGIRKDYYEDGTLMAESNYKNGKRISLVRYDKEGNVIKELKETYTKSGKEETITEYVNGEEIQCIKYEYYDNNLMKSMTTYKDGKMISRKEFEDAKTE